MKSTPVLLLILQVTLCAALAQAAATLDGLHVQAVNGPRTDAAMVKGHVVLFEYWGVHCAPCLASIPHLSELQGKYGRDQLVVIANQCQGADDAEAKRVFKEHGGSDLITLINHGGLSGADVSAIPHCFLFSHEGSLLYEGSPFGIDAVVEKAIKNSPGFLVAGRSYQKLAAEAAVIGAMKANLSPALKALRAAAVGADAVAKDEADYLLGRITDYSSANMGELARLRTDDPAAACDLLKRMMDLLKGDALGSPYEALVKELKADKAFQLEVKAASFLADVRAEAARLGLDSPHASMHSQPNARVAEGLREVVQKFPNTKAAAQAVELAKQWGLS